MNSDHHFPEETLEAYALGKLSDEVSALLEEHLLVCSTCQARLDEVDEYIRVMKAAASGLYSEAGETNRKVRHFRVSPRPPIRTRKVRFATLCFQLCFSRLKTRAG